jgi:hypothetical protein
VKADVDAELADYLVARLAHLMASIVVNNLVSMTVESTAIFYGHKFQFQLQTVP